jgi:hypothetical protein
MYGLGLSICCLSLLLIACAAPEAQVSSPSSLSDVEKQREWEQKGLYVAETLDEASRVTGYRVNVPSFIPEGFSRAGKFDIYYLGTGRPRGSPESTGTYIAQSWKRDEDPSIIFILWQSPYDLGISRGTSIEVGGNPGNRIMWPAENGRPARVTIAWKSGGMFYSLVGILSGPLDESVLMKIASSAGIP